MPSGIGGGESPAHRRSSAAAARLLGHAKEAELRTLTPWAEHSLCGEQRRGRARLGAGGVGRDAGYLRGSAARE